MKVPAEVLASLSKIFGDRCVTDQATLELFGKDYSYHGSGVPDVIVSPESETEVVELVKICNQHAVPIIPYGKGTSLEGHTTAARGGVCLSLARMDKIIAIHDKDMDVVVQPGLSFMKLNVFLKPYRLYFPLDAGPDASIGGMTNTCASGTKAVRYGTMKHNVLSLRVVLPNGTVVRTGTRARKSSAGYDLTHLFVGSEGTLGIVTEITLRVHRIPEHIASALVTFPTIGDAANAVIQMMQQDIALGMVELLDELMMKAINKKFKYTYEEKHTLYLEFTGATKPQLEEQEKIVRVITQQHGGGAFRFATSEKEREDLWKARKAAFFASTVLKPGADILTTDVCVPISRLAECIVETHKDLQTSPLPAPLVGHVGDGNFHLFVLLDSKNPADVAEAKRVNKRLIERAIRMEGTCTGEHGVGVGKREFLVKEHGMEALNLMHILKSAVDPKGIMNPGKIFPDAVLQAFDAQRSVSIRTHITSDVEADLEFRPASHHLSVNLQFPQAKL